MSLKVVAGVMYGTDPELFFERDGHIIGAEKVVPAGGLKPGDAIKPSVVLDGVQIELNPQASTDTLLLGRNIGTAFELIQRRLERVSGAVISYKRFVDVSQAELDSLSKECRILGCKPSKNVYRDRPLLIDTETYTKRSTGGHMHFGLLANKFLRDNQMDLIPAFDIFAGIVGVMFDRDPNAAERRENYGRVGEFRTPKYGVEYRTLSSFWLRNYVLFDLVFGMAKVAIATRADEAAWAELQDTVDIQDVINAVDTNDFSLSVKVFNSIRPFLVKHLPPKGFGFPLNPDNLDKFQTLAEAVNQKGLETYFPEDPMTHWVGRNYTTFENYIETIY